MRVSDFLAHFEARQSGKTFVHFTHAIPCFPALEDRERFLSIPWYIRPLTAAQWEAEALALMQRLQDDSDARTDLDDVTAKSPPSSAPRVGVTLVRTG